MLPVCGLFLQFDAVSSILLSIYGVRTLTVNKQNPEAVGFYKHMGFAAYKRTDCDEEGGPYPLLYMKR